MSGVFLVPLIALAGIEVHEWGVLTWDGQVLTSAGAPAPAVVDPGEMETGAPVLCFHGDGFTGTVTVASPGLLDCVYPDPDAAVGPLTGLRGLGSFIGWEISATREEPAGYPSCGSGSAPLDSDFAWAAPTWREGDALYLTREDGFSDRFLYYAGTIRQGSFPPPLEGFAVASAGEDTPEADRVLLFTMEGAGDVYFVIAPGGDVTMADRASPFIYSCDEVIEILEGWAGGELTHEEVRALWLTWEDEFLNGSWPTGSRAVFVVPDELVERTSTITVEPDGDQPVEIRRFFLGFVDV
ncbi:MAG: hypothetical protein QUS11_04460 [Candidatus Fermentibacter sp.]|nr:hypothetical protein [Candidatus Fermentibacter sp.]